MKIQINMEDLIINDLNQLMKTHKDRSLAYKEVIVYKYRDENFVNGIYNELFHNYIKQLK